MSTSLLLDQLLKLKKEGPRDPELGICAHVSVPMTVLYGLWVDWPHYSGRMTYPVPCPKGSTDTYQRAAEVFMLTDNIWEGAYGDLRWDLVDHMIKRLSEEDS